jgi:secreted PhoX family phosphatase
LILDREGSMSQLRKALFSLGLVVVLAGCSSSSTTVPPGTTTTVYATANNVSGVELDTFAFPISNTSPVVASLSSGAPTNLTESTALLADSAGRIWVLSELVASPQITVYTRPLTAASAPVATITLTGLSDPFHMAFDAAGNLWVSSTVTNQVFEYNGPWGTVTGSQTPTANVTLSGGLHGPEGLAFDAGGKLYVANQGSTTISVWNTPLSGGASNGSLTGLTQPDALAFDSAGNLYSGDSSGNLVRFNAGFALGATPNIVDPTATSTLSDSSNMSFDANGNLYIADCGTTVTVFTAVATTFSATSAPSVRLNPPTFTCVGGVLVR